MREMVGEMGVRRLNKIKQKHIGVWNISYSSEMHLNHSLHKSRKIQKYPDESLGYLDYSHDF